ncbi:MAG: LEA type 2 family protein [Geobacteraceae bacterium]|nr:LEA type 2 family protein [Geobacteraceae bacterium]
MKKLPLLLLLLITACSMIVEKPKVNLADVRFGGLDDDGVTIDFLLTVTNPNSFDLPLNGYSYTVHMMALPLARGESRDSLIFPGKTATDVLIPARLRYNDVLQILKRRPGLNDVPYQLTADLSVGTPIGDITVPVRKSGMLAVPEKYRPGTLLRKFGDFLKRN